MRSQHKGISRFAPAGGAIAASWIIALVAAVTWPALAQQPKMPSTAQASDTSDAEMVVIQVRTTLVAVHQANVTGNYTVLRDLGAPGFRDNNSAADLARIFAPIREQRIDLSAVVLLNPQLSQVEVTAQKMLHIAGTLATKPVPVNFELLYQAVNGVWQINGIAVSPVSQSAPAAPAQAKPSNPPAQKPPDPVEQNSR